MSGLFYPTIKVISKMGIDAKSAVATQIGTSENGTERFYPLFAIVACTAATSITVVPVLSFGTNASTYNNIIAATTMTSLSSANLMTKTDIAVATSSVAANTGVFVNITVGATATTMTIDVYLFGFYK